MIIHVLSSEMSDESTGFFETVDKVNGVTKLHASLVTMIFTFAPNLTSCLVNSGFVCCYTAGYSNKIFFSNNGDVFIFKS